MMISSQVAMSRRLPTFDLVSAFLELTKPRITSLIVLTALAGFCVASKAPLNYLLFLHTAIGIGLLSSGIATLNQYLERKTDGLMRRTESRPLPSHRLTPTQAAIFGVVLSSIATLYLLVFVNGLTALLGLATLGSYLFIYTPMKTRSWLCTAIGAFPGAMPPLIGWTAARGRVGIEAFILFAILFLWQFPHFLSIAWLYQEDYERAGIQMLPVVEPDGKSTGRQIVIYTLALLPASLLPTVVGISGGIYFVGALALSLVFAVVSIRAAVRKSKWEARRLLLASIVYLPMLFVLMVVNSK